MLSGEGMHRRKTVKINNRSNQQKQLCTCSTLFLYISLPLFCTTTTRTSRNFLVTRFIEELHVVRVPVHFFSQPLIFTCNGGRQHFPLCHRYKIFMLFFQQKNVSGFFISRSKSLSPFFLLIFAGLPSTFSFSLTFSCSIFQMFGHDNIYLSLILQTTLVQKQFSPFIRFRLY